ncbi:AAA family ATPase [Clostridium sp. Cult1]|uniref:AAA family ATPase n=1 Tax=Clostridium sp. Cult1 TaxID=2079002 RepID=UPI001F201EED|nr:AAA family ATPase [Clostridium sp. Cult1]
MRYIKKIILENFQSHKYTEVEFDQYLNVIVGPSDHGKTAIIRGIKWALFNEPSGDFFIREGENECSVTIVFSDGSKIKRYRNKTKNAYYLYDSEGKETVFEGFGTKVPREIIERTSMRKIILDSNQSSSINIGEQLEGPFLLSEKNSTRANAIGRLVGVHIIDDALKDTLKDIRNLNIKRKNHEEILENLKNNLSEYDYLDDLKTKTEKLKIIRNNIYNYQSKLNKLVQISKNLIKINKEIALLKDYLNKLESLNTITDIQKELTNKIKDFNFIFNGYNRLIRIQNDINYNKNLLVTLKNIDKISEITNQVNSFINRTNNLYKVSKVVDEISTSILNNKRILEIFKETEEIEEKIAIIEKEYLRISKLLNLKEQFDNINRSLAVGKTYIEKLSLIDNISQIESLLDFKINQLNQLKDYYSKYYATITRKFEIEKGLSKVKKEMSIHLKQYKTILSKLEVCPLCFSDIDKYRIEEIINNYR